MTSPTFDPRAVLAVPWLVAEPDLVTSAPAVPTAAQPFALPLAAEPDLVHQIAPAAEPDLVHQIAPAAEPDDASKRPFYVSLGASVAWCILAAGLLVAGALTPASGNALFYLVCMAGLFCATFTALTYPRPDGDETFVTLGGEPATVGQCTPSRVTLTGRCHE